MLPACVVIGVGDTGEGGSYPGCWTPRSHIGSVHLSGTASLSNKYLIALSKWPLPCLATVRRALALLLGLLPALMREGRERSVVDDEKVCENHPERRSPRREDDGPTSGAEVSGFPILAGRGIATGSTTTGLSSPPPPPVSPSLSRLPRNLLPFRNLLGAGVLSIADSTLLPSLLGKLVVETLFDRLRSWFCLCRNFGSFDDDDGPLLVLLCWGEGEGGDECLLLLEKDIERMVCLEPR